MRGDENTERCFACGATYRWGTKGSGSTLALCPECNDVAEDLSPSAGLSWWQNLLGMIVIALGWRYVHPGVAFIVGIAIVLRVSFKLNRLGREIRRERGILQLRELT
jgi:hypothetical protein